MNTLYWIVGIIGAVAGSAGVVYAAMRAGRTEDQKVELERLKMSGHVDASDAQLVFTAGEKLRKEWQERAEALQIRLEELEEKLDAQRTKTRELEDALIQVERHNSQLLIETQENHRVITALQAELGLISRQVNRLDPAVPEPKPQPLIRKPQPRKEKR